MTKLLDALRSKHRSPAHALEALGLPASLLPLESRFVLAQDAQTVTERSTGRVIDKISFIRQVIANDAAELSRALASQKEDQPMSRSRVAQLAHDQDLPSKAGIAGDPKPNLDQESQIQDPSGGGGVPSAEECLQFVQLCMQGLDPDELNTFLSGLSALISTGAGAPMGAGGAGDQGGLLDNNKGALDRRGRRSGARDKRPAQDSTVRGLNHQSFIKRFPIIKDVDVWR